MQNLRQLLKYEKGIGRFRGEASFFKAIVLAAARSPHGSDVINVIHYRSVALLRI